MLFISGDRVRINAPSTTANVSQSPEGVVTFIFSDRTMLVVLDGRRPMFCTPDLHQVELVERVKAKSWAL